MIISSLTGWICPVCGQGVAPWVQTCPCKSVLTINNYGSYQYDWRCSTCGCNPCICDSTGNTIQ